jgi:maltose alpha-D-glucosyltransferase/alpha-amylase
MGLLGRRIGELHRALCLKTGDALFDPEPLTLGDFERWKAAISQEVDTTFASLEAAMPAMPEATRKNVEPLMDLRESIRSRVRNASCELRGLVKTRYHGDLHLGQVLVVLDDFIIVDFEGEPGRTLEERRAKGSVMRDVAGMLRSFSYAAHSAALRREPGTASTEAGMQALAQWEGEAIHHFLEGYGKATEALPSVPADAQSFRTLLDLFLIEKALYELRYEIANRPDWIAIPLRGLLELTRT